MSLFKRALHVGVGIGVVTTRKVQETVQRLEEEGRQLMERPGNPLQKVRERVRKVAQEGERTLESWKIKVYYTLGLTPLEEMERLHQRIDDLESRVRTGKRTNASYSDT